MKLTRWTLAGASFYVIYKYTIGKKAKGEDVFATPASDEDQAAAGQTAATPKPKRVRKPRAKA